MSWKIVVKIGQVRFFFYSKTSFDAVFQFIYLFSHEPNILANQFL